MEECCVCEELKAEYTCRQCDEYVCEDCCVAMTYHNQIDYTCCHNCRPDEPTMGDCNKPLKLKTMEYLTELKPGMRLPLTLLFDWAKQGNYCSNNYCNYALGILDFKNLMKPDKDNMIFIITVAKNSHGVPYFHARDSRNYTQFNLSGFIEFYNKFYNLTPRAMNTCNFKKRR